MSKLRDIVIEVQDLIEQNQFSYEEISRLTGAPLKWVYDLEREMSEREHEVLYENDNS